MAARPLVTAPTSRWVLAVALAMLVAHESHELAHTWVGRAMCGAWGARDFNVWSLASGCTTWVPTLVGPVFSWALMWIGVALLASTHESRRWVGIAFVFAPNPLGRLLPALMGGGDEGVVARDLLGRNSSWPRLAVVAIAAIVILPPLVIAWRALPTRRRLAWFLLLFAGGILVTGPLLLVLGNGLLERGVLSQPGLFGAPILVELVTAVAMLAFAVYCRELSNRQRS